MGTRLKIAVILWILLGCGMGCQVHAQKRSRLAHRLDSLLTHHYQHADIDTNYVIRPKTKWTLKGRFNFSGASIKTQGTLEGEHFETEMRADYKSTLSLGIGYLGLSLNLALNPKKMLGRYGDFEMNFRSYGKRLGFDLSYHDANTFTGWHEREGDNRIELTGDVLSLKTLNLNAYYCFNHRKFSYPAAFSQSYIQRRSAGSFMLALSGQAQKGTAKSDPAFTFKMTNIGIGGGYGYNYVPGKGWLLHISALPTLIIYSDRTIDFDGTSVPLDYHFPEVIITGRGAVIKQLGRAFIGLTQVLHFTGIGDKKLLAFDNQKWMTRLTFGWRL